MAAVSSLTFGVMMEDTKHNPPSDNVEAQEPPPATDTPEARLAEAERTIAELRDAMLRKCADIENQRRRLQRDLDQARRFANERLLGDLLPVFDSLEQGMAVQTADVAALREGMQLTLKSLHKVAEGNGLKTVDPLNQAFDPERHQAMNTVEAVEQAPDTVVAVLQKGYLLNDRLLRPALVTVTKAPGQ